MIVVFFVGVALEHPRALPSIEEEFSHQSTNGHGVHGVGHGSHGEKPGSHGYGYVGHGDGQHIHGDGHNNHSGGHDGHSNRGDGLFAPDSEDHIFYNHQVLTQDSEHGTLNQQLLASPRLVQPLPPPHATPSQLGVQPLPPPHILSSQAPVGVQPPPSQLGVQPLPPPHAPPSQLGVQQGYSLSQLEVLYKARGRQVEELTRQLSAVKEENNTHVRILREKIVSRLGARARARARARG